MISCRPAEKVIAEPISHGCFDQRVKNLEAFAPILSMSMIVVSKFE